MAVATNEYGLFINGETVEGSSSRDLIEPASGEVLGTAQLAGEAEIDRAVEAARAALDGDWGKTPANERSRLLHALADAIKANRNELVGARVPQRRQGDLVDQGRALRRGRELPLLRVRDRLDRRPLEPDRRLAPLLHAEGARRRRRPDRPLELPAADDDVEARARARGRLRGRAEAGSADAGDRAAAGRARRRGRLPGRRDQHRHRRRPDHRRLPRHASGRRQDRVHRLDEDGRRDHAALLGADQAPDARAGRQEPEPRLRRRRPRLGDPERGLVDLLRGGPELRGALARARRAVDLRRLRRRVHRQGKPAEGRRPARRGDADGLADLAGASGARALLRRGRARGGRRGRARR